MNVLKIIIEFLIFLILNIIVNNFKLMKITKIYIIIFLISFCKSIELDKKPIFNIERQLTKSSFSRTTDNFLTKKNILNKKNIFSKKLRLLHPKFTFNVNNLKIDRNLTSKKKRSLSINIKTLSNINFKNPDLNLDILNGLEDPIQKEVEIQNYDPLKSIANLKRLNQILIQTNEKVEMKNLSVSSEIDRNPVFRGCVSNLSLEFKVMSNLVFYLKKCLTDILPEEIDFQNKTEFFYQNLVVEQIISEEKYEYILKNGNIEVYRTNYQMKIQKIIEFFNSENFEVFRSYSRVLKLTNFNKYYNYFKKEVMVFEKINTKLVMTIPKAKQIPLNFTDNPFEKSVKKMIINLREKLNQHEKNEMKRFKSIENKIKTNNLNISVDEHGTYYANSKRIGPEEKPVNSIQNSETHNLDKAKILNSVKDISLDKSSNIKKDDEEILNTLKNMENETKNHKFDHLTELLRKGIETFEENYLNADLVSSRKLIKIRSLVQDIKTEIESGKSINEQNLSVAHKLIIEIKDEIEFEKNLVDDPDLKEILDKTSKKDIALFKEDVNDGMHFNDVDDFHNDINLHMHSIDEIEGFNREEALKEYQEKNQNLDFDEKELISEEEDSEKLLRLQNEIKTHGDILNNLSSEINMIEKDLNEEEGDNKKVEENSENNLNTESDLNSVTTNLIQDVQDNKIHIDENDNPINNELSAQTKTENFLPTDSNVHLDNKNPSFILNKIEHNVENLTTSEANQTTSETNQTTSETNQTTSDTNQTNSEENITTPEKNLTTTEENVTTSEANLITPEENLTTSEANLDLNNQNTTSIENNLEKDETDNTIGSVTLNSPTNFNNMNMNTTQKNSFVFNKMKDGIINEQNDINEMGHLNKEIKDITENLNIDDLPKDDLKKNNATNLQELKDLQNKIIEMTNEIQKDIPALIEQKKKEELNSQDINNQISEQAEKKKIISYFVDDRKKFQISNQNNKEKENYHFPTINDFRLTSEFEKDSDQKAKESNFINNLLAKFAQKNLNQNHQIPGTQNNGQIYHNDFENNFLKHSNSQGSLNTHLINSMDPYKNRKNENILNLIKKEEPNLNPIFDDIKKNDYDILNGELPANFNNNKEIQNYDILNGELPENLNHNKISNFVQINQLQNSNKENSVNFNNNAPVYKMVHPVENQDNQMDMNLLEIQRIQNALDNQGIKDLNEEIPFEKK